MGKVMSTVIKPIRNFNVENRAMRAMDRQAKAPKAAPRHETTKKSYEQLARGIEAEVKCMNVLCSRAVSDKLYSFI